VNDKKIEWSDLLHVADTQHERDGVDLFAELVDTARNSDAFMFIPMVIEEDGDQFHVETTVQLHDQINLTDGDVMTEAIYLSALGALLSSCFTRLDRRNVIDYMTSLIGRIMETENNQPRH